MKRPIKQYFCTIAKCVVVIAAPCFFTSTSISDSVLESPMRLNAPDISTIDTNCFFDTASSEDKVHFLLPASISLQFNRRHHDTEIQNELILLRAMAASLQRKIEFVKKFGTMKDDMLQRAEEALRELRQMQNILESEHFQSHR